MRCHYDVLSVEREATDDEIKKSYRRLALQYHPDKNPDNPEVVELFREVQSAYDVLSDKQERAWYDKHREAILKGGDDYVDDAMDLMHYFNPSVYSGFDDSADSFYTVFRDAFSRLSKEDESCMDGDEFELVPEFGFSNSDYETVVKPFYIYWLAYRTKKSYVWKQMYDVRTAANRPTQRLMEKENKKLRDTCRKKRNEEVRALVMYVRKRDKRVQEEAKRMKEKQEESKRKTKEIQEMQKLDRSKILENYEEQEWMAFDDSKLDHIDSEFNEMFGSALNGDTDESDNDDYLYCIACDKNFKSEKALANHEKSKKHKENVTLIKNELEGDLLEELCISDTEQVNVLDGFMNSGNCDNAETYNAAPSGKRSKKKKRKKKRGLDVDANSDEELNNDSIEDSPLHPLNHSSIETAKDQQYGAEPGASYDADSNDDCVIKQGNTSKISTDSCDQTNEVTKLKPDCKNKSINLTTQKIEKSCDNNNGNDGNIDEDDDERGSFGCEVCPKVFPTRNKLFKHIKAQGHAMLREAPKKTKSKKGKGKK